jgi:hypothetical protein
VDTMKSLPPALRIALDRFSPNEIRNSLQQIAARWTYVLGYHEKKAIARNLGGNKYAKTTHAMLDILFESILDEVNTD